MAAALLRPLLHAACLHSLTHPRPLITHHQQHWLWSRVVKGAPVPEHVAIADGKGVTTAHKV